MRVKVRAPAGRDNFQGGLNGRLRRVLARLAGAKVEGVVMKGKTRAAASVSDGDACYLPDFSAPNAVVALVLISQLVALVLTLANGVIDSGFFSELVGNSLLILWTSLSGACVLKLARPVLVQQSVIRASLFSFALILVTVAVLSEAVYWIGYRFAVHALLDAQQFFPADRFEFLVRNLALGALIAGLLLRYFYVSHQWRCNVEREAAARISALQARIRPHFLFNAMNTIAALTRSDPPAAERATEDLADLFRASLNQPGQTISLEEELEVAQVYQRMEEKRLGQRLQVDWNLSCVPMRTRIPGLTLQPLLENAIYHGIEPRVDGGTVTVEGKVSDDRVIITVTNPLPHQQSGTTRGNRIALDNIRERLELAYGKQARMDIDKVADIFRVQIGFPRVA